VSVVVAHHEFESWFLAGVESLRGKHGLAADLTAPENPEEIRGAKEWLSRHMPRNRPYSPTLHQAPLAAALDLNQAQRARSFRKLRGALHRFLLP
jgi:hypothetical protein